MKMLYEKNDNRTSVFFQPSFCLKLIVGGDPNPVTLVAQADKLVKEDQPASSNWRDQIPAQGLQEYWYPAVQARKVGKKRPVAIRLLGENLVFFRSREGEVVALQDLCPHRGGRLSQGACHFPGTVTCPYHAWTFDSEGKCVAALVEGPESRIPSMDIRVPIKAVRVFRGIVWVWIGKGAPVPLEEDVPEEFLDPSVLIFTEVREWPVNWRPLIENAIDGHAPYVHRDSLEGLLTTVGPLGQKLTPMLTYGGRGIAVIKETYPPMQQVYPGLGRFPKRFFRKYWLWLFRPNWGKGTFTGKPYTQEIVLPGMTRIAYPDHLYIRWGVPVDERAVKNFYWHFVKGALPSKAWFCLRYYIFRRWARNYNLSEQDRKIVASQDFAALERLSWTDAVVVGWRKMVLEGFHVNRVKRTHESVRSKGTQGGSHGLSKANDTCHTEV